MSCTLVILYPLSLPTPIKIQFPKWTFKLKSLLVFYDESFFIILWTSVTLTCLHWLDCSIKVTSIKHAKKEIKNMSKESGCCWAFNKTIGCRAPCRSDTKLKGEEWIDLNHMKTESITQAKRGWSLLLLMYREWKGWKY